MFDAHEDMIKRYMVVVGFHVFVVNVGQHKHGKHGKGLS